MKKFRRTQIYKAKGVTNVTDTRKKSGVYLIYKGQQLVYIGMSQSNIYKALLRHFQSWNDPRQIRVTYPQTPLYKVSIVYTTPKQAPRLEKALIIRLKPKDNPNKYGNMELTRELEAAHRTYLNTYSSGEAPF